MAVIGVYGRDLQPGDVVARGTFQGLTVTHVERSLIRFNSGGATRVGGESSWYVRRPPQRDEVIADLVRVFSCLSGGLRSSD